jgi:hypothetical protein
MPHLHLSLQHGADLILKRMKRRHLRADAVELVTDLTARRPDIAVGADLIAGFPTEGEAEHADNLSIIEALGIVHGHIFPFSPRATTPAARMPQVPRPDVTRRAAELRAAVADQRARWLSAQIGRPQRVLAERDGTGHAENFARIALPPARRRGRSSPSHPHTYLKDCSHERRELDLTPDGRPCQDHRAVGGQSFRHHRRRTAERGSARRSGRCADPLRPGPARRRPHP